MKKILKKLILFLLITLASYSITTAQITIEKLEELTEQYNLTDDVMRYISMDEDNPAYSFMIKESTSVLGTISEKIISYDPKKATGKRWRTLSKDGKKLSEKEGIKDMEEKNLSSLKVSGNHQKNTITTEAITIEKETDTEIVVLIKADMNQYWPAGINSGEDAFVRVYLNKEHKQVDRFTASFDEPVEVETAGAKFKMAALKCTIYVTRDDKKQNYLPSEVIVTTDIEMGENKLQMNFRQEFYDYHLVVKK